MPTPPHPAHVPNPFGGKPAVSARAMRQRGGKVRPGVDLDPRLLARIEAEARRNRRTRSAEMAVLLEEAMAARGGGAKEK